MKKLASIKTQRDEIISIELPDEITVFTTKNLFRGFNILIEYTKSLKDEKDYIILVYQDTDGFHKIVLDTAEKLSSRDVMYYLNELIEFVSWCNGNTELIRELNCLWSQGYIFIPSKEEGTIYQNRVLIGIKVVYSIVKSNFELINLNEMGKNKESNFITKEILDSIGRKRKVKFFNYTDKQYNMTSNDEHRSFL